MREFILRALKAKTSAFDVDNLAEAGRMDIVSDCISSALFIAGDVRRDTIIHIILDGPNYPPKLISFTGSKLKNLDFSQKSIAEKINYALIKGSKLNLNEELDLENGIKIFKKSFEQLIKEKSKSSQLIYLNKKGQDIRNFKFKDNITFVFGDYIGMPRKTEKLLERLNSTKVNLGPKMLFASHCIVLVNNELDRIHSIQNL